MTPTILFEDGEALVIDKPGGLPVERPAVTETTAQGAAFLAGLGVGVYTGLGAVSKAWRCERRFEPAMAPAERDRLYGGWRKAVARVVYDPEGDGV